jgi:hypothetical protein
MCWMRYVCFDVGPLCLGYRVLGHCLLFFREATSLERGANRNMSAVFLPCVCSEVCLKIHDNETKRTVTGQRRLLFHLLRPQVFQE